MLAVLGLYVWDNAQDQQLKQERVDFCLYLLIIIYPEGK